MYRILGRKTCGRSIDLHFDQASLVGAGFVYISAM